MFVASGLRFSWVVDAVFQAMQATLYSSFAKTVHEIQKEKERDAEICHGDPSTSCSDLSSWNSRYQPIGKQKEGAEEKPKVIAKGLDRVTVCSGDFMDA